MPSQGFTRNYPGARTLLMDAACDSLERIREDQKEAPARVKALLIYLEMHLFDPGLNVNLIKEACGIRDNSIALGFHSHVGQSPKAYISARRLETAAKLLTSTDLKIWQIGELTGYSSLSVFGKAFAKWAGIRPSRYRQAVQKGPAGEADVTQLTAFTDATLAMVLTGSLPAEEAQTILERLLLLYPQKATITEMRPRPVAVARA